MIHTFDIVRAFASPLPGAAASEVGAKIDLIATIVFAVTGLVVLSVMVAMVVLVIRFRRTPERPNGDAPGSANKVELIWGTTTALGFAAIFVLGALGFDAVLRAPADPDPLDIIVLGHRWMWEFQQPNGRHELEVLHIPVGRAVRLHLSSDDVIHSFYAPDFRVKHDVVPGMAQALWLTAAQPGTYDIACAEYCGTDHARMRGTIIALDPADYAAWLADGGAVEPPQVAAGRALFERHGCATCHESADGRRAPPLGGLHGQPVLLQDGARVIADDDYMRRSIVRPGEQIVAGYDDERMPAYAGVLDPGQLDLLLAYLRASQRQGARPR